MRNLILEMVTIWAGADLDKAETRAYNLLCEAEEMEATDCNVETFKMLLALNDYYEDKYFGPEED